MLADNHFSDTFFNIFGAVTFFIAMFLHRSEVYRNEKGNSAENVEKGIAEVIIGKHRAGPLGTIKLAFNGEFTRFDNMGQTGKTDPPASETS